MDRAHQHTDIELNFVLSGSGEYFHGGRRCPIPARRLTVLWAGVPHMLVRVDPGTEYIWVTVPLAWFLAWNLPEKLPRALLGGKLVTDRAGAGFAEDTSMFERWVSDFDSEDPERRRIGLLEIEARIRRLALAMRDGTSSEATARRRRQTQRADTARTTGAMGAVPLSSVEQIADYLATNYRQSISIGQIAEAVRLHPNYAMSLFKKSFGMSIWEYVVGLRISHAQRLLITTDAKILEVSLESGFQTPSRFYDAFLSSVGCTPRAYRARNAGSLREP
jgi:AraC-like DNA-binding protein